MENVKSYLDGELDIAQKAEVETHLRNDAELQKMVEEFSAISTTLKTADSGEPYGLDKLEERLAQGGQVSILEKKKIWRTAATWSLGSVCVLILGAIMFPVFAQAKSAAKKTSIASRSRASFSPDAMAGISGDGEIQAQMKSDAGASASSVSPAPNNGDASTADLNNPQKPIDGDGTVNGTLNGAGEMQGSSQAPMVNGKIPAQNGGGGGLNPGEPVGGATGRAQASIPKHGTDYYVAGDKNSDGEPRFSRGGDVTKAKAANPTAQWYRSAGKPLSADQPESQFKSEMRAKRDGKTQAIPGLPETDHGIYLERSGEMQVKVEDLKRAVNEATGMVTSLDGFVTSSNTQNQADGGVATMTLRVPTKNFMTAIDKLEAMGELISENTGSLDITKPTVDNSARMISWADEEKRLIDELAKAKNNDQRWRIRGAISNARANLEAHKAEVNSLLERAKYSTLELSFVRGDKASIKGGTNNWSSNALRDAKDNLGSIGQVLGTAGIYFLVFCPIWLPFAIAAFVIRKRTK